MLQWQQYAGKSADVKFYPQEVSRPAGGAHIEPIYSAVHAHSTPSHAAAPGAPSARVSWPDS